MFYSLYTGNSPARLTAWIIGLIGLLGNSAVIIYTQKTKYFKTRADRSTLRSKKKGTKASAVCNFLILNLAIADLIGDLYLTIIVSADTYYGHRYPRIYQTTNPINQTNIWIFHPLCHVARFCYFTSTILSILITLVIAVDRFTTIIFPFSKMKLNQIKCRIVILLCWIFASSFGLYPFIRGIINVHAFAKTFIFPVNTCLYEDVNGSYVLRFINAKYTIFYICCCLIFLCYISVLIYIKKKSKSAVATQTDAIQHHILLVMIAITISNVASILPSTITYELFRMNTPFTPLFDYMLGIGTMITFSNTACNPIIYMLMSPTISKRLCFCKRSLSRNKISDSNHNNNKPGLVPVANPSSPKLA